MTGTDSRLWLDGMIRLALACLVAGGLGAAVSWEATIIERPASLADERIRFAVPFTVAGDAPVSFLSPEVPCGCAEAAAGWRTYQPGEKGALVFDLVVGERVGPQDQPVIVRTDATGDHGTELRLRTDIPAAFAIDRRLLRFAADELRQELEFAVIPPYRLGSAQVETRHGAFAASIETVAEGTRFRIVVLSRDATHRRPVPMVVTTDHPVARVARFTVWALHAGP